MDMAVHRTGSETALNTNAPIPVQSTFTPKRTTNCLSNAQQTGATRIRKTTSHNRPIETNAEAHTTLRGHDTHIPPSAASTSITTQKPQHKAPRSTSKAHWSRRHAKRWQSVYKPTQQNCSHPTNRMPPNNTTKMPSHTEYAQAMRMAKPHRRHSALRNSKNPVKAHVIGPATRLNAHDRRPCCDTPPSANHQREWPALFSPCCTLSSIPITN